ncbi:hypothetical protein EBZ80_26740, partial [bacterium]|nr:hypothetical protein [bacterium]
ESVVFCENSSADLSPLVRAAEACPRPVEFLTFQDAPTPPHVHYGFGELGIVDHAVESSRSLKASGYFLKGTGRLVFPGIKRLLDALPDDLLGAVDHRWRYRGESDPPTRARTQLMLFDTDFYRSHLLGCRREMPGFCTHIEVLLAHKLAAGRYDRPFVRRFPVECSPSGVGGHGKQYDSLAERTKSRIRGFARRWLPGLWI